jgi:hypothetical protein
MNLQNFDTLGSITTSAIIIPTGVVEALERGIIDKIPYEITIATTATAQIEGRISSAHGWVIIGASTTATEGGVLQAYPEMRLNVTAWTAGDVDASVLLP